jgi:hypothetical protein
MAAVNWNDTDCQTLIHKIESLPVLWKTDFKDYGKRGPRYTAWKAVAEALGNDRHANEILWICDQHMTCAAHRLHNRNLLVNFVADRRKLYTLTLQCLQNANNIS